ncbi:hypothetical protein PMZ80_010628 [Knufia obscura]|uniref:Major facilitator superfamily (MFS) profile domain-containing protein n=2 Tax=Knufia TaxID=430999 RepID=A0AAN8I723_9EURO|nr:hypothetical protein PMZ80_010628 [Knufia obscura]KAK5955324.1 hypothetical protein OHC33_004006 [Knufia fluminis]
MTGGQQTEPVEIDPTDRVLPTAKSSSEPTTLEKCATANEKPDLTRITSHHSHHEIHAVASHASSYVEVNAAQYTRFSPAKKHIIVFVLSVCGFLAPVSSTAVLAAIPEVAQTYDTTGSIINLSNALYLIFMGISPCFYGPLSQIYGRRWICIWSAGLFTAMSVGTALAPNLAAFYIFRMLTAFQGTSFLIVGTSCIGDIFTPTERGTALSWFLVGTLVGPCLAPLLGGAIVTYVSWRNIFWMQTGMGAFATILVIFFLPETIPTKGIDDLKDLPRSKRTAHIVRLVNPIRVSKLLLSYPNLFITGLASSSLVWNMYSLLTPIRFVLNPRFHLTSPWQSGLFFVAPGCGYLLGTFFGGRASDWVVKRYIAKRNHRVAEDRLRTVLIFMGIVIPACMLVYGWSVEKAVGGIPLPVIAMFLQGVAQLMCFPSLNTYCVDVMQSRGLGSVVVAGNYQIRYVFAAAASAVCLPAIEKIGVGWFSTISALFLVVCTGGLWLVCIYGQKWRHEVDAKKARRKAQRAAEESKA